MTGIFYVLGVVVAVSFLFHRVPYVLRTSNGDSAVTVERSLVHSLKHFLVQRSYALERSDKAGWGLRTGEEKLWTPATPLKVYIYEMPARFTFDLLSLFQNTYQETTNLTSNGSPVHRLIEQVRCWRPMVLSDILVTMR